MRAVLVVSVAIVLSFTIDRTAHAEEAPATEDGEELYERLSRLARQGGAEAQLFHELQTNAVEIDWSDAETISMVGNVRQLQVTGDTGALGDLPDLYLVREESGEVYVLAVPEGELEGDSPYGNLDDVVGKKTSIEARAVTRTVEGRSYTFIQFTQTPERLLLDRLFFIAIIVLLFLTMVGMGLTLTIKDFGLVFRKPAGIIVGLVCQFGLLPLLGMAVGRAVGYYETYPFIFLGLILIASSPGGVTSNLMTYFGKGDLALSVSLTAICTVLALFFTPLLLKAYGGNIPAFTIPVMEVVKPMAVLVIIPLFVGMLIRRFAEGFAKKSEKVFAFIGIFALLFLIAVGILGHLDKFADTNRYGVTFYAVTFALTFAGMVVSGLLAKLLRIKNFQVRAISIECGLRNASLAMTIAILLQDRMGDFYSSMLFTSGIFGLWMYIAGAITIWLFPKWLPVTDEDLAELKRAKGGGDTPES